MNEAQGQSSQITRAFYPALKNKTCAFVRVNSF